MALLALVVAPVIPNLAPMFVLSLYSWYVYTVLNGPLWLSVQAWGFAVCSVLQRVLPYRWSPMHHWGAVVFRRRGEAPTWIEIGDTGVLAC